MFNNNTRSVSNDTNTQPPSNQQDNSVTRSYVKDRQAQTSKATAARKTKLVNGWEGRLKRMGLSEHSGDLANVDGQVLFYGAEYLPDTAVFNYGQPTRPHASVFGTSSFNEMGDLQNVMEAESQPRRGNVIGRQNRMPCKSDRKYKGTMWDTALNNNCKPIWPNEEASRPNYRLCVFGGKAPAAPLRWVNGELR